MGVDEAGRDGMAFGIDLARALAGDLAHFHHPVASYADVGDEPILARAVDDRAAADDEIESLMPLLLP
jgi:hypothetical protein